MSELLKLLLFPVLIGVGWTLSRSSGELARKLTRVLLQVVFAMVVLLAITGGLHRDVMLGQIHRWSAHALVIVAWLAIPAVLGTSLQQHLRARPFGAIGQSVALTALLLLTLSGSFTGYLGPASYGDLDEQFHEETRNRFIVLHMILLPAIIALLTAGTWWFLRPRNHPRVNLRSDDAGSGKAASDPTNPYRPPQN